MCPLRMRLIQTAIPCGEVRKIHPWFGILPFGAAVHYERVQSKYTHWVHPTGEPDRPCCVLALFQTRNNGTTGIQFVRNLRFRKTDWELALFRTYPESAVAPIQHL